MLKYRAVALSMVLAGSLGYQLPAQSYHPGWAPDGQRLVLTRATTEGSVIVLHHLATGAEEQLTQSTRDYYPVWSPDGRWIAFVSERHGNPELYLMRADGSGVTRLTNSPGHDVHPVWAGDSRRLAFDSDRHGNADIFVIDIVTGSEHRVTSGESTDIFPSWQPGDSSLVVSSDRGGTLDLYRMTLGGVVLERLTTNEPGDMDWKSSSSPDGRFLVYASARNRDFDIYLRKNPHTTVKLTGGAAVQRYPIWSPSGDRIAYVSNESGALEVHLWDLTSWQSIQITGR